MRRGDGIISNGAEDCCVEISAESRSTRLLAGFSCCGEGRFKQNNSFFSRGAWWLTHSPAWCMWLRRGTTTQPCSDWLVHCSEMAGALLSRDAASVCVHKYSPHPELKETLVTSHPSAHLTSTFGGHSSRRPPVKVSWRMTGPDDKLKYLVI